MPSIPASTIVSVNPGVVAAGGAGTSLNGLLLSNGARVPLGSVISFPTQLSVASYFGAASAEALWAASYFTANDNSTLKPGALLIAQFNQNVAGAWLRGASVAALTLAQLQAINATLAVTINGTPYSGAVNLSAATGFVNAASIINAALAAPNAGTDGVVTGAIALTTLTVSAVSSGQIQVGDILSGSGVTAGTYVTAFLTGTGGTGTYTVSASQTVASTAITASLPAVSYDAISGGFLITSSTTGAASTITFGSGAAATSLNLTQATGAVTSQGAIAATEAGAMNAAVGQTQNFVSFATLWQPNTASKLAFAAWGNGQNNRYLYVFVDTDVTATQSNYTGAVQQMQAASYASYCPIYDPSDLTKAAFVQGTIASIDPTQTNGRTNLTFRTQSGLAAGVTSQSVAAQLEANGFNYYGAFATATQAWNLFKPGIVGGPFKYADTWVDQVILNTQLQAALVNLLVTVKSVPYNDQGYGQIRQACTDPILAAVNFGAIRANVPLSGTQAAAVNAAAGAKIDDVLSSRGWYLQILAASPVVRAARGSPPMNLWYMDGGSVQQIAIASVAVL